MIFLSSSSSVCVSAGLLEVCLQQPTLLCADSFKEEINSYRFPVLCRKKVEFFGGKV